MYGHTFSLHAALPCFSLPAVIEAVVGKAAAPFPADRFANAVEVADALGAVIFPPEPVVDQSRLDTYQVSTLPFFRWPQGGDVAQNERCVAYPSGSDDDRMFVKVWTASRRGQSAAVDLALLAKIGGASGRDRVVPYVLIAGVAVTLLKKKKI